MYHSRKEIAFDLRGKSNYDTMTFPVGTRMARLQGEIFNLSRMILQKSLNSLGYFIFFNMVHRFLKTVFYEENFHILIIAITFESTVSIKTPTLALLTNAYLKPTSFTLQL